MKMSYLPFIAIALLSWLSSCKPAYRIYSELERGMDYSHYHTYQWSGKPTANDAIQYVHINPNTEEKIRSSSQAQLARFGIELCEDEPDLTVHYHVLTKNASNFNTDWQCSGKFHRFQMKGYCESIESANLQDAMLVIDIVDEKTGNQIWRGAATGGFNGMNDLQRRQNIEEAVRRMFEKFPATPLITL